MAFVLEDGTGIANANAYISPTEMKSYHLDRGVEISAQYNDTDLQRAIVKGTDHFEQVYGPDLLGRKLTTTQALSFPRACLYEPEFCYVPITGVPPKLKYAIAEYALRELINPGSLDPDPVVSDTGLQVSSTMEKAGPIEERVTYLGSEPRTVKSFPKGDRWVVDFVGPQGGSQRA